MPEQIREALSQVAVDTFEKLAFMFAFPEDGGQTEQMKDMVSASVVFSGPFSGLVTIRISGAVLPELAANMLGMDDEADVTLDQQHDALKETLNVICGNLLPAIAGQEPIFNMEMPRILSQGEISETDALFKVRLEFDEGQCEISIHVDGEIPEGVLCSKFQVRS
jgi:CheY-specific phosphatase CheX